MEIDKIIEKTREALAEHIQMIIRKGGNMTPPDIDFLFKDLCALETLKRIETEGADTGYSQGSYARGRGSNGQFVSRNSGNSSRSYDGNSGNSGYSGHSIQDRMIDRLEQMMDEAQSENERQTVRDWINRLRH